MFIQYIFCYTGVFICIHKIYVIRFENEHKLDLYRSLSKTQECKTLNIQPF